MTDPKSERRARSWGYGSREAGDARDANPYSSLPAGDDAEKEVIYDLAVAWWRGWDQADAIAGDDSSNRVTADHSFGLESP